MFQPTVWQRYKVSQPGKCCFNTHHNSFFPKPDLWGDGEEIIEKRNEWKDRERKGRDGNAREVFDGKGRVSEMNQLRASCVENASIHVQNCHMSQYGWPPRCRSVLWWPSTTWPASWGLTPPGAYLYRLGKSKMAVHSGIQHVFFFNLFLLVWFFWFLCDVTSPLIPDLPLFCLTFNKFSITLTGRCVVLSLWLCFPANWA